MKAHRLDYSENDWRYFEEHFGTRLDRLTNLYALFLLKIWEDLAPHGRAAVLLPAEFLNGNFGEAIKERVVWVMRPPAILVFAPAVNLFAHALTTSAIVLLEKGRTADTPRWLTCVESVAQADRFVGRLCRELPILETCSRIDLDRLNPRDKWLNKLLNGSENLASFPKRVGDYFECSRGIATGANDYFCLSRHEMSGHGLTEHHVEPCITKAADADGLVFTREKFEALAARGRRCFLLNPPCDGPALAHYLELGEQLGIPRRHLPSHRPRWYLPENRGGCRHLGGSVYTAIWEVHLEHVLRKESDLFPRTLRSTRLRNLGAIDDTFFEQHCGTACIRECESFLWQRLKQARTQGPGTDALPSHAEAEPTRSQ